MATLLIKQRGQDTAPTNEYLVQAATELSTIDGSFGDRAYAIDEHTHYVYGTEWVIYVPVIGVQYYEFYII